MRTCLARISLSCLFAFVLASTAVRVDAATPKTSAICPSDLGRTCVALVLGGGGARGSAHIGVLKVIEELQIPVDLVVGTSIGSFVGGLYASGYSAQAIEKMFLAADWNTGYQDKLDRSRRANRHKRQEDAFPIQLDIGFDGTEFKLPRGLIQGRGMKQLINSMLGIYPKFGSFNDLPIPFRAVAAEAETGKEVVLSQGDLATAMQTSMSLPGILRPIEWDGRLLVDGGVANNLPVSVAKELGADLIIAVDIGTPPAEQESLLSSFDIMMQMTNFLTKENQSYQRSLLGTTDILIKPDLETIDMLDFESIEDGIRAGEEAASEAVALHQLSHPIDFESRARSRKQILRDGKDRPLVLKRIELDNKTALADEFLLHRLDLLNEEAYYSDSIQNHLDRLYGQGTLARLNSSFETGEEGEGETDAYTMLLTAEEKEWGPGYLDFKLSFEDDFSSFSLFEVGASYLYTNLNPYGAELFSAMEFGTRKGINSELYWPIKTSGFFVAPALYANREVRSYAPDGDSLGDSIDTAYGIESAFGYEFSDRFDIRFGASHEKGNVKLPVILQSLFEQDKLKFEKNAVFVEAYFDSLNDADFPRKGWRMNLAGRRAKHTIYVLDDYVKQVDFELKAAVSLGRHALIPKLRIASSYSDQDQDVLGNYTLGGFLNLSGNERGFLTGPHLRFASLVYTYQLARNDYGALKLPLYLGLSLEAGNIWSSPSQVTVDDLIVGQSSFIGWDSPLGPAFLAYGRSEEGQESFYISLGIGF